MKKLILAISLLCVFCVGSPAQGMKTYVEDLASAMYEGRGAGTEGEKEAAEYMGKAFRKLGLDLLYGVEGDVFGMKKENGDTLVSRNVAAVISGYDRELKEHYIVIGARLDNLGSRMINVNGERVNQIFRGANGNASGLAMMLQLAENLSLNRALLKRSVIFVAFGAAEEMNAGSWYFLNRSFSHVDAIDAYINLDMLGTGSNGFYAYTCSNPDMNNKLDALRNTLQPVHPKTVAKEPVRSDHRSFYAAKIPSVFFTTGMYPEYNTVRDTPSVVEYDWMERLQEYVFNFTVSLANGVKPEFEAAAPTAVSDSSDGVVAYSECDYRPTFLGSPDPGTFLKKWVYVYLKYPKSAVDDGVQGRVLVDFIIDEKGRVGNVKVLKGVDPRLDAEAVKAVASSPDWKPGRLRGRKVKTELSIYVEFRLKKNKQ